MHVAKDSTDHHVQTFQTLYNNKQTKPSFTLVFYFVEYNFIILLAKNCIIITSFKKYENCRQLKNTVEWLVRID